MEAVAERNGTRIVLRYVNANKTRESIYFYHTDAENPTDPEAAKAFKSITTDSGEARFQRLWCTNSRVYNHILTKPWGSFKPREKDDTWIEYQYLEENWWVDLKDVAKPRKGPIDEGALDKDLQALWKGREPILPPNKLATQIVVRGISKTPEDYQALEANETSSPEKTDSPILDGEGAIVASQKRLAQHRKEIPSLTRPTSFVLNLPGGSSRKAFQIDISPILDGFPDNKEDNHTSTRVQSPIPGRLQNLFTGSLQPSRFQSLFANNSGAPCQSGTKQKRAGTTTSIKMATPFLQMLGARNYDPDSSQHPVKTRQETKVTSDEEETRLDFEALQERRVMKLGKIDGLLTSLENTVVRYLNRLDDGVPPIALLGHTIQTPDPEVILDDALLAELNAIAYRASTQCSKLVMNAMINQVSELQNEKDKLLEDWNPSTEETAAAAKIAESRTKKQSAYRCPTKSGEKLDCWIKGDLCFKPNPETARVNNTNATPPKTLKSGMKTSKSGPRTTLDEERKPGRNRRNSEGDGAEDLYPGGAPSPGRGRRHHSPQGRPTRHRQGTTYHQQRSKSSHRPRLTSPNRNGLRSLSRDGRDFKSSKTVEFKPYREGSSGPSNRKLDGRTRGYKPKYYEPYDSDSDSKN